MSLRYLTTADEVEQLLAASADGPVWILKHSDECGLSSRAFEVYGAHSQTSPTEHCVVVVQDAPQVSRLIERSLNVLHETPQALLVVNGEARWNASHRRITLDALTSAEQ